MEHNVKYLLRIEISIDKEELSRRERMVKELRGLYYLLREIQKEFVGLNPKIRQGNILTKLKKSK